MCHGGDNAGRVGHLTGSLFMGVKVLERVMVFIDLNNFKGGLKTYYDKLSTERGYVVPLPKFDITKISSRLCNGRTLLKTFVYTAQADEQDDPAKFKLNRGFIETLRALPRVEPIVGYLSKRPIPGVAYDPTNPGTYIHEEKETDVNIAKDLLIKAFYNAYDTAILVSADRDYAPVLESLKEMGKIMEVAVVVGQKSHLRSVADSFRWLDETFMNQCLI